jgi:hypothetical protein
MCIGHEALRYSETRIVKQSEHQIFIFINKCFFSDSIENNFENFV